MAHRLVEQILQLDLVEVLVLAPQTLGQLETVVIPGRGSRRLEGDGALCRTGLHRFLEAARHLDRPALVPEVPLDFANDGRRSEGRKLQAPLWLEALDRGEQADVADLDDVLEWLATVAEFL